VSVGTDDYDSPWKDAIETYLADCLALFFPEAYDEIDWTREHRFLDQELQQVQREAERGRQLVDKLAQVYLRSGVDAWVLVHVEIQSQPEAQFAKRMFTYYYRLLDRFDRPVVSLALLGDERSNWRPQGYEQRLWGYGVQFSFRAIKLLDYREQMSSLEASQNPFATIVAAHLAARETRRKPGERLTAKLSLIRRLYSFGYDREKILGVFRFVDWVMRLPEDLDRRFWDEMRLFEEEAGMPYITSVERLGRQAGLREGLLDGLELALKLKFGASGLEIMPEIRQIYDVSLVRSVYASIEAASTIDDVRRVYR
jgi:hypothetical protein